MILVEPICESGGKKKENGTLINEDCLMGFSAYKDNTKYNFTILMDGATGLGEYFEIVPNYTSAEWYVKFMSETMKRLFIKSPEASLEEVVEESILKATKIVEDYETNNNVKLEEYQKPSAGLELLRTDGIKTEIFSIGDTQGLVAYKNGEVKKIYNPNEIALQNLDKGVLKRMVEISKERNCDVVDTRKEPEIDKMLKTNRNKKNTYMEGSYWTCGTTPGTARNGSYASFSNKEIDGILLATDGFDFSILDLNEKQVYDLVKEKGSSKVSEMIREKQEEDSKCNKFPRFKKSDDLTVIYFDYRK